MFDDAFDDGKVRIQFTRQGTDGDDQEAIRRLSRDITDSELGTVELEHSAADPGSKAGTGLIEWAAVALSGGYLLRDLLRIVSDWAQRAKNPVRLRIGDDELIVSDATGAQQQALVDAFVAKHGPQ